VYNFHPPLTAFPLALFTVVVVLEGVSLFYKSEQLRMAIKVNVLFAGLAVVCAFYSGYWGNEYASQTFEVSADLISQHHVAGRLLLFCSVPCVGLCFIWEKAKHRPDLFRGAYYGFLSVCFFLVLYTGYLGAGLVFDHGAGVMIVPRG